MAPTGAALAHGFGQTYSLHVPLWLYLFGAAAAVVLSFVLVGFFIGDRTAPDGYPRYNLLGAPALRAVLTNRLLLFVLRVISVLAFILVVAAGFLGDQNPSSNFAPTFVWVIWWVGLGYFTALVGNIWPLVNPWTILFNAADALVRRLGLTDDLELDMPYPRRLGVWPAVILYFVFIWLEIVYEGAPAPANIAFLTAAYSIITWAGMVYFGKHTWLRYGEAFSVLFGVFARFAPTEVRVTDAEICKECGLDCSAANGCVNCYECFEWAPPESRQLNLRPWAVGLSRVEDMTFGRLAFIVLMLASVTMDGFMQTVAWVRIESYILPPTVIHSESDYLAVETLGLLALPALFLILYYAFSLLIRRVGAIRARSHDVAAAFVYSLVPIALAYQFAHYYTLLLVQGQSVIALISDPFGWGWDLFGTAGYRTNLRFLDAGVVWYSQVALIVAGHVFAMYLAHVIALRLLDNRSRAQRSQYPMLVLMVLYTVSSLWIISQPLIVE